MDEITTALASQGFVGADVQNSVRLYRISYRTQRLGQTSDIATALVVLPAGRGGANVEADDDDADIQSTAQNQDKNRNNKKTLVVYTHGTIPYATSCADSRHDPLQQSDLPFVDLELYTVIALAAHGFPVAMPDYAGFVAGSRASGYLTSEDEAHAALDVTRVQLVAGTQDNVVVVGHSRGGHAALSVQSLAKSYGLSGKLAGVVAFAPFWAAARSFGAILTPGLFDTHDPTGVGAAEMSFAIEYFYTHAELYDGPGAGKALFTTAAQQALPGFVSTCDFLVASNPSVLGQFSTDIFQSDFIGAVAPCGGGVPGGCSANDVAKRWEKRFAADRPKLDPNGAPVVLWQGKNDQVVTVDVAACGIDTIKAQLSGNKFKVCADANGDHESIEPAHAAWVTQWIEARTLGAPEPTIAGCQDKSVLQLPACSTPGGNVD
jgi:pimeloyl-ACP methyl ester carboxylesterase